MHGIDATGAIVGILVHFRRIEAVGSKLDHHE